MLNGLKKTEKKLSMRLHLSIEPSKEILPFNYQPLLTGALHKWIGENNFHDHISMYSFSWLKNGQATKNGLQFKNGSQYFISSHSSELLKNIIKGIQDNPKIKDGFSVQEIMVQDNPQFKNESVFYCASPILIKRNINGNTKHYTFGNEKTDELLTETLKHKLKKAGLSDEGVNAGFDRSYRKAKTKVIHYKSIGNLVNICPIKISGTPEQLAFAWNVGVGNSTGIGFGSLK